MLRTAVLLRMSDRYSFQCTSFDVVFLQLLRAIAQEVVEYRFCRPIFTWYWSLGLFLRQVSIVS